MLKGKTVVTITKSTMIAAVQMYLDATFKESHVVTDVKADSYGAGSFVIDLDDGAQAAKQE